MEPSDQTINEQASPHLDHAYDQLDFLDDEQRQKVARQVSGIVDFSGHDEIHIEAGDSLNPSEYQSEVARDCIEAVGNYFRLAYDPDKSEDDVWADAISLAIDEQTTLSMQPYDGEAVALIIAKLSGVKLTDEQTIECLDGSRQFAGIAAWSEESGQYEPISIDETAYAYDLIDRGETDILVGNLEQFRSLPGVLANQLATEHSALVARAVTSFDNPDYNYIAHRLTNEGDNYTLASCLRNFRNLDNEIADKFMGTNSITNLAHNLASFSNPDYQKIADKFIEYGETRIKDLAKSLANFHGLNNQTAQALLGVEPGKVIKNREVFPDLAIEQILDGTSDTGIQTATVDNIEMFSSEEQSYISETLLDHGSSGCVLLADAREKFGEIDETRLIDQLLQYGAADIVLDNLEKFKEPDIERIVNSAIETKNTFSIADNIAKLHGLSPDIVPSLLIIDFSYIDLAQHAGAFANPYDALSHLHADQWENPDLADAVVENIHSYHLAPDQLNEVLTKCAQNYSTAQKIKQFDLSHMGLDQESIDTLLKHISTLKPELTDVRKDNPYESTSGSIDVLTLTKPGTEIHKLGSQISKLLREAEDDDTHKFNELATVISNRFGGLKSRILHRQEHYDYDDVLGNEPDSPTNALFPTYRRLVADFIALEFEESGYSLDNLSQQELKHILVAMSNALSYANDKFFDVLGTDVPYYDKLYTEWDAKRLGQKDFQEVFLGRDGVYAYMGRRAQLQARKRFLGIKGESHELTMPTYLVYPRTFRDSLNPETKSEYLFQNITNPQAAHYYDTGFTGTIPQDIMRVLGVSEADWDERIRLLSASKRDRTVLGLEGSKDERDQIVNTVEYNVKNESTAQGLYDGDGDALRPYAQPTTAAERLAFGLVQQALHRHYYVREMRSLQSSETRIAMTAQTLQGGELRLSTELSEAQNKELTDLFDHDNIGQRLLATAQTIKLSDPNDPYPDEAVFEVPLSGTDGVIVKSVVTDKQQGPLDEFEALILLQKLGIDSPKPLGRIFTSGQHGFIVMEKLPGISGRAIKQYFDDNSIPEPEQTYLLARAKEKMTEVAETVRRDTGLDKPWRLKDFMIVFGRGDDGNGLLDIQRMLPIDFERAKVFDPQNPHSIELGQGLNTQDV